MMNTAFKNIGIWFLLTTGIGNAFAGADEREWRDARQQSMQHQAGRGRDGGGDNRGQVIPDDHVGDGSASKKVGRMSPEEKRALRRQIDEAGRDIYAPRR
jgi:hypothetical protein